MDEKRVLFISGSLGLGHVNRDLAITNELRKLQPAVEISWLAAHPATIPLENSGETLLEDAAYYANENELAENSAKGSSLNLMTYLTKAGRAWKNNFQIFKKIINENNFDLIIGDETYEILVGLQKEPDIKKTPFVIIFDIIGLDAMSNNPLEKLGVYLWNRVWSIDYKHGRDSPADLALFIGETHDVPDKSFGFMLPNRLEWAKTICKFVGYVFQFNPSEFENKRKIREALGYGSEKLIVCAIGGTSIGKSLLELCGQAFHLVNQQIPDLRMVLVCGPRLSKESLKVPEAVEVKEYLPDLYKHFAASDLSIVQGGGTSTLELTALKKPFIFFPIEGHFEQARVAERLDRYNAGLRMILSQTTPELLAEKVVENMNKEINYTPVRTNGAENAAKHIIELL